MVSFHVFYLATEIIYLLLATCIEFLQRIILNFFKKAYFILLKIMEFFILLSNDPVIL
jgi:hypothetical protein